MEMAGKRKLVNVLGAILVLTIFHSPITVDAGEGIPPVALFTFGDSNYDVGNKVYLGSNKNPAQTKWPYGKSRDDPNGKFSDGYIVPDFIAEFMSIPGGIPAALQPGANLARGASFAIAGASIIGNPVESLTLFQQVIKFNRLISTWSFDYIQKSLFMIYIGTEDYLNYFKYNYTSDGRAQKDFVDKVTNQLKSDINTLYVMGARKFMVQLLPPLGCLPIVRQEQGTGFDKCEERLNDLVKQHNAKIGPMLNDLAKNAKGGGFQFSVFDFYNAVIRRTQRNLNYRFYESNISCCGVGTHNAYGCGMANVHSKLCDYQRGYFFFDGRHNTEKAQEELAHVLYAGNLNVVQPMNCRELIVYPVGDDMLEFWDPKNQLSARHRPSADHNIDSNIDLNIGFSAY